MSQKLKSEDKRLEIQLFEDGLVEIESPDHKRIGIRIQRLDPTETIPKGARGALYRICPYIPEDKSVPFEYGVAFIMPNGEIFSRAGSYLNE